MSTMENGVRRVHIINEERFQRMVETLKTMEFDKRDNQVQKWIEANAEQLVTSILETM